MIAYSVRKGWFGRTVLQMEDESGKTVDVPYSSAPLELVHKGYLDSFRNQVDALRVRVAKADRRAAAQKRARAAKKGAA